MTFTKQIVIVSIHLYIFYDTCCSFLVRIGSPTVCFGQSQSPDTHYFALLFSLLDIVVWIQSDRTLDRL